MKNIFNVRALLICLLMTTSLYVRADEEKQYDELGWELATSESMGGLKLGMSISSVAKLLGAPSEVITFEQPSWVDGEYHETYKYASKGVELDLIVGENEVNKTVNAMLITAPCTYKTKKGIGIGSRYKDVTAAYEYYIDPSFSSEKSIVAGSIYGGVIFSVENGKVAHIFFGAAAE